MTLDEMKSEMQRMREERNRSEIVDLIIDLRQFDSTTDPGMDQAVARVQKFLDDHR